MFAFSGSINTFMLHKSYSLTASLTAFPIAPERTTYDRASSTPSYTMPPKKELDPQLRSRICELKSIEWGVTRIHREHPDIPIGTIKTTLRREKDRANNVSKPRSGRPRKLTEEQRDHVYNRIAADPRVKIRTLIDEIDGAVQKRSIQRILHEMDGRKAIQGNRSENSDHAAIDSADQS
jgi:hypothetical protein